MLEVRKPVIDEERGDRIYAEICALAGAYVMPADARMGKLTFLRVSDGTRTRDRLDHNQELYQLSYAHHAETIGLRSPLRI